MKNEKQRYARLLGEFWRNPKVRRLSNEARGVLVMAWSYAADQMTDGAVPSELLAAWCGKRHAQIMAELTRGTDKPGDRPMLALDPGEIDARAIGWEDVNITRDGWAATKAAAKERQRLSRVTRAAVTPLSRVTERVTDDEVTVDVTRDSLDEGRRTKDEGRDQSESESARESPAGDGPRSEPRPSVDPKPGPRCSRMVVLDGTAQTLREAVRKGAVAGYESLKMPPPKLVKDVLGREWHDLGEWVGAKADLLRWDDLDTARHLMRCFLRSPAAKKKGYPIAFLVANPNEYWRDELPGAA